MKPRSFEYIRAQSIEHACRILAEHGGDAQILAGGQSLVPLMNMRLAVPKVLIDINELKNMGRIAEDGDRIIIGALARYTDIEADPLIRSHIPLFLKAIRHVAHPAIRNRGTIGGSFALADPAAELPACGVCLDAIVHLQSVNGRREILASEFFEGVFTTARRPDEILTEISIPKSNHGTRFSVSEVVRRAGDLALAGVVVSVDYTGSIVRQARLVFFGVADRPTQYSTVERALLGNDLDLGTIAAMGRHFHQDPVFLEQAMQLPLWKLDLMRTVMKRALNECRLAHPDQRP